MTKIIIEYIDNKNDTTYNVMEEKIFYDVSNKYNIIFKFIEEFESKYNIPIHICSKKISDSVYFSNDLYDRNDCNFLNKIRLTQYKNLLNNYVSMCKSYNSKFVKYSITIEDIDINF